MAIWVLQVKKYVCKKTIFKSSKRCLGEVSSQSEEEGFLRGGGLRVVLENLRTTAERAI